MIYRRHGFSRLVKKSIPLYYLLLCLPLVYLLNTFIASTPIQNEAELDINEKLKKPFQAFLVVVVMSSADEYKKRQAIRETWLEHDSAELLSYFVIGTKSLSVIEKSLLNEENKQYSDLLLLDSFVDKYSALTTKLLKTLKWLSENVEFRFALKADIDSYVRVQSIILELQKNAPIERYYWGYFDGNAPVYRKSKKWAEPKWSLCDKYLPYAMGGGYVLSEDLVEFVAKNSNVLQLYNSEDVSLGCWLSPLEIKRHHDRRFDTEYISRGCDGNYLITHKQSSLDIRQKHKNLMLTGNICGGKENEYYSRGGYNYNWKVLPSKCCNRIKNYH